MRKIKHLLLTAMMAVFSILPAWSEPVEITGVVIDDTGETVIGASVVEKGTSNGTVTDFDGNFTIKVEPGSILTITYLGYQAVEVAATQGMRVEMLQAANELNEVVVTGYVSEKKADLTGSVSVIKMKDVADVPTGNILSSLNGRVAGVNISTDGAPGSGNTSILLHLKL